MPRPCSLPSAKISQFALLPHGRPEAARRALAMVAQMDALGFGNCTNHKECEMECPKGISISNIARLNREFLKAALASQDNLPALPRAKEYNSTDGGNEIAAPIVRGIAAGAVLNP